MALKNYINSVLFSDNMPEKIIVHTIIEVLGKPKEHVQQLLKEYVDKLKKEKDLTIIKQTYSEPKERQDKLFGMFVELEIRFDSFHKVIWFTFDYRPASIEIVEPEDLVFNIQTANEYLNDVLGKLHTIDLLLTNIAAENKLLKNNGIMVAKNFIKHLLRKENKDKQQLIKDTGIPESMLMKFLQVLEKEGQIQKQGELYKIL